MTFAARSGFSGSVAAIALKTGMMVCLRPFQRSSEKPLVAIRIFSAVISPRGVPTVQPRGVRFTLVTGVWPWTLAPAAMAARASSRE